MSNIKFIVCYKIIILPEDPNIKVQQMEQIKESQNTDSQVQNLDQIKIEDDEEEDSQNENYNKIKGTSVKKYPQNQEYKGMFQRFCTLLQIYPPGNSKKMQYFLVEKIAEAILDINNVQNQRLKLLALEYKPNNSQGFINELIGMLRFCRNKLQGNVFQNLNAHKAAKTTYKNVQKRLEQLAKQKNNNQAKSNNQ